MSIYAEHIAKHKQHQFVYCYDSEERKKLINALLNKYPIIYGENNPSAIKLNPYGIILDADRNLKEKHEQTMCYIAAREYLKNQIVYQVLAQVETNNDIMSKIEMNISSFLSENVIDKTKQWTLQEYLLRLKANIEIYQEYYTRLIKNVDTRFIQDLPNDILSIDLLFKDLKMLLNNNGQINIVVDYNKECTIESVKAMMSIINDRWSGTICMKIFTNPEIWPTYYDLGDHFLEERKDYDYEELDDSYKRVLSKRKIEMPDSEEDL